MKYTDLVFDLYGTLVDIHTEENLPVWEKTAIFFGYYGAHYSAEELQNRFLEQMRLRQTVAGQSYECFPDIPVEQVMSQLFCDGGVTENAEALGLQAAQLFRIVSTEYIKLYPHVTESLVKLRKAGFRLWLLSNAQRVFTAFELQHLGLGAEFDGIYLSSDFGCRKPDRRFYEALLQQRGLDSSKCLMIGNDRDTDIAGAKAVGMDTLYMHTNLTPAEQYPADLALHPDHAKEGMHHYEWEGYDWQALTQTLLQWSAQ